MNFVFAVMNNLRLYLGGGGEGGEIGDR
jgi:hypothetical protein